MSIVADISHCSSLAPQSGWQLFRSLVTGTLIPGLSWQNPAYRRKFLLRSLATPFATGSYLTRLAKQPDMPRMLQAQPGLPCRLHRPWLSINTRRKQAADALCWHYSQMARLLPTMMFDGYLSAAGCNLAQLVGKDEQTFSLRLCADPMLDKEGEATLKFCDAQDTVLAELTFTLCQHDGKNTLYIGGLQGAKAHVPHQQIQQATKACHGLFPKRLLVETAMELGRFLAVLQIRAVSNETHIYRHIRYRRKKKDKLHADYNSFWQSLGAVADSHGDFALPDTLPRKPLAEIASKKRAEYRRRFELLDSLHAQISGHFGN